MRYLAQKHNLMGSTPAEKARCDMLADGANELFTSWGEALWANDVSMLEWSHLHARRVINTLCGLIQEKREKAAKDSLPEKLKFHEVCFDPTTRP